MVVLGMGMGMAAVEMEMVKVHDAICTRNQQIYTGSSTGKNTQRRHLFHILSRFWSMRNCSAQDQHLGIL